MGKAAKNDPADSYGFRKFYCAYQRKQYYLPPDVVEARARRLWSDLSHKEKKYYTRRVRFAVKVSRKEKKNNARIRALGDHHPKCFHCLPWKFCSGWNSCCGCNCCPLWNYCIEWKCGSYH